MTTTLPRRAAAEFTGTALLVTAIVGSGIAASQRSPGEGGLQLLENSTATALALAAIILIFAPLSGAHLNPVVSLADWWLHRRSGTGIAGRDLLAYVIAQTGGAIVGAIFANVTFGLRVVGWSATRRSGTGIWLAEIVATAGLVLLVFALARTGRASVAPAAIGGYIGAAYWFASSTSFANPAVTVGRAFTASFAGIAPASVAGFVLAQLVGLAAAVAAVTLWYPDAAGTTPSPAKPDRIGASS